MKQKIRKYMTFVFFSCVKFAKKKFFTRAHTPNFLLIELKRVWILFVVDFRVSKNTLLLISFKHTFTHTHQYLLLLIKNFIKKNKRETNKEKDNFATFVKYHKKWWIKANNKVNSKKLIKNKNITETNVLTKIWFITSSGIKKEEKPT